MGQFYQIANASSPQKSYHQCQNSSLTWSECTSWFIHPHFTSLSVKASLWVGSSKSQWVLETLAISKHQAPWLRIHSIQAAFISQTWWKGWACWTVVGNQETICPAQRSLSDMSSAQRSSLPGGPEARLGVGGDTCCWGGGNLILSRQSMDGVSRLCNSCCSPATCLINEQ